MTKSRKPNRFEMTFLMMFHGVLTGSILLTYLSGDDVYFLHKFAGYVICAALLMRLAAALLAPKSSPLRLSLPKLFVRREGGRSPVFAWMAVALITATAAAALSGLLADSVGFKDLHEGLAEGILPIFIFAHMALVLWRPLVRRLSNVTAEDADRIVTQATAVGTHLATLVLSAVRRAKPYLQGTR
jgi:hypothetical protein